METKTILILAVNPKNTTRLRLDNEIREIEERLKFSEHRNKFTIKIKLAVRIDDFREALVNLRPTYVHFCGHGDKEFSIVENVSGETHLVKVDALGGLFEAFKDSIECVVLNACHSQIQAEIIAKHIKYVVGMSGTIKDKAAVEYSKGFYDALFNRESSIEWAHKLGCNAIELHNVTNDSSIPLLFINKSFQTICWCEKNIFNTMKKLEQDKLSKLVKLEILDFHSLKSYIEELEQKILKNEELRQDAEKQRKNFNTCKKFVYINAIPENKMLAVKIREYLLENNIASSTPLYFNGKDFTGEEMQKFFKTNLLDCDATIILYNKSSKKWVDYELLSCNRIQSERSKPLRIIVLNTPPPTPPPEKLECNVFLPNLKTLRCIKFSSDSYNDCLSDLKNILLSD